ncbi:TPR-like protein [Peniophora sp. CONT]|nr:TPR-like protein [Peniophora sp. CONT]
MGENSLNAPARRPRFQLSESLKKDAKGAVKTAVECLGVAASATQNVPYLGIISGALAEFLKIEGEVTTLKSDWKAVMSVAQQIKTVIDRVHAQCKKLEAGADVLPEGFLEPLMELERCIAATLEVLDACKTGSKRFRDRARVIINRMDLSTNVKQCRTDMQAALDLFNTKLHIINAFTMQAHGKKLDELLVRGSHVPPDPASNPVSFILPPPPAIFHGRAREVDHIVNLISDKPPARVAVLGSGGIGKTSIALTVLHRPEVEERYGEARFFMSCEATSTAEGVLQELLKTFRLAVDTQNRVTPRDQFISHLRVQPPGILCLDNLETPWDADASGVESLLADIVSLSHFALLVTTRGGDRPRGVAWTQPFLAEITPLTLEAALDTWNSICGSHDGYSELLVQAVDLVPLAVTLLAQLALIESSEILWRRWELEQTSLLQDARGTEHRLNSVERSIVLSLTSPTLRDKEHVLDFFSVLCMLPQGIPDTRISAFVDTYATLLPNIRRTIAILKKCSLAYTSEDRFLRVLSPIRHYMQSHHPCSDVTFAILADIYCYLVESEPYEEGAKMVYARASIQPELINIPVILELSLSRKSGDIRRILDAVVRFSAICNGLYAHNTTIVSRAIAHAKQDAPEFEASLWTSMGDTLRYQHQYDESLFALSKALELHRIAGDQVGEANSLYILGILSRHTSKNEEAEKLLHSALDLYTKLDMSLGKAQALVELGDVYSCAPNRNDETERVLRSALDIYEQIGDKQGKADVLVSLGGLDIGRGRLDEAKTGLTTALDLHDEIDYPLGKANAMNELGRVYTKRDCDEEAEAMLQSALDIYRELNDTLSQANSINNLGQLYRNQELHDKAVQAFKTEVKLYGDICDHHGKASSLLELGRVYLDLAQLDEAERSLESALVLFRDVPDRRWESITLLDLGFLRRLQHRYEEACNSLQTAHEIAAEVADLVTQGNALIYLGRVHQERRDLDAAQSCFEDALELYERMENSKGIDVARASLKALGVERRKHTAQESSRWWFSSKKRAKARVTVNA